MVERLRAEYPDSLHVRDVGLRQRADAEIWDCAKASGFAVVSKDTDFRERSFLEGAPPKVIWLDVGNAGTREIEVLLRSERHRVEQLVQSASVSLLILSIGPPAV
ncbi:MAG: hypothetical protein ABS36_00230 [Acidobacteria bacterium SCN 69-37]|nr:MAG: hypothetical protein ABS36_00230 [Acidobacteria bacterium SCN 69-37]